MFFSEKEKLKDHCYYQMTLNFPLRWKWRTLSATFQLSTWIWINPHFSFVLSAFSYTFGKNK
jgi:hypothetical protein